MPMPIASAKCRRTPALIDGLCWSALALVSAFCTLASLESMLSPHMGVVGSGRDMVLSWLVRIPVFLVNGVTVLITALVVLNAAGPAGRLKPALAVAAAVAGCVAASLVRYAIGATPAADGPAFMVSAFTTWFIPAAALVAGYVFYLHTRAVREEANSAELQRAGLEKQQLETRLCLLQAQAAPCSRSLPGTCARRCRGCATTTLLSPTRSSSFPLSWACRRSAWARDWRA